MTRSGEHETGNAQLAAQLETYLSGAWTTQAICVAAHLRLADLIGERARTSAELATLTDCHEPSLRRLLRALVALGVLRSTPDDAFELAPLGRLLRADDGASLHAWAVWWGRSLWPAWGHLGHSVRTGESGRSQVTGTHGFDHLAHDPEGAAIFYRATVELTRKVAPAILAAYDFAAVASIVDVGGGHGELLASILRASPRTRGTLLELPQATEGARRHLESAGIGDRWEVVAGDFFVAVPPHADVYLLKSVLHDWTDERAARILDACRRAMSPSSKLLVLEHLLPERAAAGPDRDGALADLTMLVAHGAGERSAPELEALIRTAGFAVTRTVPVGSTMHLIEAIPAGRATVPASTPASSIPVPSAASS